MDIKFEKTNECEGIVRTCANAAEVAEKRKDILNRYARGARIPGFRPGKAPMSVVIKHFQNDIREALLTQLFDESMNLISGLDTDVRIVDITDPEITEREDGPCEFLFHVSFVPPFDLPHYEGIEVSQVNNDVSEEEVTDFLRKLARSEAIFTEVDRPAAMGDRVIFDFRTSVEGKSLSEFCGRDMSSLDSNSDYRLELSDTFLPALSKGLVGAIAGEERIVDFEPDENFHIPELCGKHVVFTCKIKKIQGIQVPDIESEDFVSAHDATDSQALRSHTRAVLEASKRRENVGAQKTQITDYIVSHVDFPLPRRLVETQMNALLGGAHASETIDEAKRDALREDAVKILRTYFTFCAIAEKEGLAVTNNDLAKKIMEMAFSAREHNIKSYIRKLRGDGRMNAIQATLTVEKTLTFLLEKARIVPHTESATPTEISPEAPSAVTPAPNESEV